MDIRKIAEEVINRIEYQPGYPAWDERERIIRAGKTPAPGMSPGTTWCNAAANEILIQAGYDTSPILNIHNGKPSIGWTSANNMYINAVASATKRTIREVSAEEAQELANKGTYALVAAPGKRNGHVAVVMPCSHAYNPEHGCFIAQAGGRNGFYYVNEMFVAPGIYPIKIRHFVLNKKK